MKPPLKVSKKDTDYSWWFLKKSKKHIKNKLKSSKPETNCKYSETK